MADKSTQVSTEFTGPGAGGAAEVAVVSLTLEQEPFPQNSGEVKTIEQIAEENDLEFIEMHEDSMGRQAAFSSNTDEINELYQAQCGKNPDGSITATVYVFKSPVDLEYRLVASRGTFEEDPVTGSTEKEESLNFHMETSVDLGYNVEEILSVAWDGDVYDASGSVVYPEVPMLSGTELFVSLPVYGTVRVKYTVFGDVWLLNIPSREDAIENEFQSTVHAFYGEDQVETIEISPPSLESLCTQRVTWSYNADDEQPSDEDGGDDVSLQLVAYDYCTGEEISGATFYISGKKVSATGHTVKSGNTYQIKVTATGYTDTDQDELDNDSFSV